MSTTLLDDAYCTITRFCGESGVMLVEIFNKSDRSASVRRATEAEKRMAPWEAELEFTEAQLRAALEEHSPSSQDCDLCGGHVLCSCDYSTEWSAEHVVAALKSATTS